MTVQSFKRKPKESEKRLKWGRLSVLAQALILAVPVVVMVMVLAGQLILVGDAGVSMQQPRRQAWWQGRANTMGATHRTARAASSIGPKVFRAKQHPAYMKWNWCAPTNPDDSCRDRANKNIEGNRKKAETEGGDRER